MIDRRYLVISLLYAVMGLLFGIYMAASKNHSLLVVHAHMLLVGFVVSFIYAVIHKIWLPVMSAKLAHMQFFLHQVSALGMILGLFLLYAQIASEAVLGPILGVSSVGVLLGALLMVFMVLKSKVVKTTAPLLNA